MGWAEDKKRIAELGPSLTSLCAVLLTLAVLGVWNTFMVWRLGADFIGQYGEEVRSIVFTKTAWTALSPFLLLVSAGALFFSNARAAPVFAMLAIVYVAFGSLSLIMSTLTDSAWRPLNFWDVFDATVAVASVSFLLVSKNVQRVYGTSTRKFLTHDIVNLWRKARSRPTLEETEAVRLQDTFK